MQVDYRRDLNHNYLIIHGEAEPDTASYQIRMLLTNTIPDLLNCRIGKVDNQTLFYYDITSKQSLGSLFEHRAIGHAVLGHLFEHLITLLEELEEYLLSENGVMLTPDLIYTDAGFEHFSFCYLPCDQEKNAALQDRLRELMEYILPKLDHKDEKAVSLGYGLYREISIGTFSLDTLKNLLYQNGPDKTEVPKTVKEIPDPEKQEIPAFQSEEEKEKIQKEKMHQQVLDSFFAEEDEEEAESWEKVRNLAGGAACIITLAVILLFRWFHVSVFWYVAAFFMVLVFGLGLAMTSFLRRNTEEKEALFDHFTEFRQLLGKTHRSEERYDRISFPEREEPEEKTVRNREEWKVKEKEYPPISHQEEEGLYEGEELYEETELLGSGPSRIACLIPVSPLDLPLVILKREIVLIGKLSSAADVVLPYNTISRLHAKITKTSEGYYLTDLNSRNGTLVNGEPLHGEEKRLLEESDEITFADKKYRFTMKGF
ncbi:MAG: DUF6382 domain-containing protein [Fusicatenibacter sp.]|nr:DUF6382 domain-containing protein [Fusicatenibacter sp.]